MKGRKLFIVGLVVFSILLTSFSFYAYQILKTPNILVEKDDGYLFVPTGATFEQVQDSLYHHDMVQNLVAFSVLAKAMDYDKNVKPGRFLLKSDMSNLEAIQLLRSGNQDPVQITFNNIRLKNELPEKICNNIEIEPEEFGKLLSDSTKIQEYGFNPKTVISMFIPNTYEVYWNISAENLMERMHTEYQKFWNEERQEKAKEVGLTPVEVSTLASIVEAEQLTHPDERRRIAGLYVNRLNRGIKLDSDPTLIFAAGDFTIRRVLNEHKEIDSPYNTYRNAGLPPGPIYMPSISSIDAVLNYEEHNYIYMCAKEDFSGYHRFATNLTQHLRNARLYQNALNRAKLFR